MLKTYIRQFILKHYITRELFFFLGGRKTNLRKIDKAIAYGNLQPVTEKAKNVIVSLTSYGDRIPDIKYTIYSLVMQSIRPEKIIVNIAFEDKELLNDEIKSFEKYNVEFNLCKDIRSYKKLLPTLQRYPNACIVTADDDLYFERNWLKRLYEAHKKYPDDVCCHLVYKITHHNGKINTYKSWIHNYRSFTADKSLFLLGGAGALYPPNVFHKDIDNEELFSTLAPIADDLWFYFMVILNGRKIRQINKAYIKLRFINPYREYGIISGSTLTQQNVGENKNDVQLRNILSHYGISEQKFIDYLDGKIERLL